VDRLNDLTNNKISREFIYLLAAPGEIVTGGFAGLKAKEGREGRMGPRRRKCPQSAFSPVSAARRDLSEITLLPYFYR
jgi:hypothetical protein